MNTTSKSFLLIAFYQPGDSTLLRRYNRLCGSIRGYVYRLSLLPANDPYRTKMQANVLAKLYDMGVLNLDAKLSDVENKLTVSAFCRRRLAVVMCRSKMAETVSAVSGRPFYDVQDTEVGFTIHLQAAKLIEQGHVRVGPDSITDPAFLVTR